MGSVHVVRGDDPALVGAEVADLVHRLLAGADRTLAVDEFDGEEYDLGAVVDAARTPPFLSDHRVVVARGIRRFFPRGRAAVDDTDEAGDDADPAPAPSPAGLAPLLDYLREPLDTTDLVLETSAAPPRPLADALKRAGAQVVDTTLKRDADRRNWLKAHLAGAPVRFEPAAEQLLVEHLGEAVARLGPLLEVLEASYGAGATIGRDELEPFLGAEGSVAPFALTNAVDAGDAAKALDVLDRLLGPGAMHPLQVMAVLHNHVSRMLRLDGAGVRSEAEAAQVLGLKGSTYPARRALDQLHRLGHDGLVRAVTLLARADLDLRGARQLGSPEESPTVVLQVLVARLARLAPRPGRRR